LPHLAGLRENRLAKQRLKKVMVVVVVVVVVREIEPESFCIVLRIL